MKRNKDWYVKIGRIGGIKSTRKLKEWHDHCVKTYFKSPKLCKYCKSILSYKQRRNKFCSHKCAARANNRPGRHIRGTQFSKCLRCGNPLKHHGLMHASCRAENYKEIIIKTVESGDYSNFKIVRKYIILTRGYKCEQCSLIEWENCKISLEIHHIDGNSKNNDPSNLKLLCPNCHSITNNYKSKNVGNGNRERNNWKTIQ